VLQVFDRAADSARAPADLTESRNHLSRQRLEAFTDGVIAIIITIMVLEMKVPPGADFASLRAEVPVFLAYALSFTNVGIFWNNHHHMLHVTERVSGLVLWANLLLLFWLSLIPFAIRWMDAQHYASLPTASYGAVLTMCAISYLLLEKAIIKVNGPSSKLAQAVGADRKGMMSLSLYVLAMPLAFVHAWVAIGIYVLVALIWFVPDRRIEAIL
jgi:uncharacterized membrane protein